MNTLALAWLGLLPALLGTPESPSPPLLLRLSPAILQLELARGETRTVELLLSNEGTQPLPLEVALADLQLSPDGSPLLQPPQSQPYSCVSWLQLDKTTLRLEPGQSQSVRLTIRVPPQARGGGYGVVTFSAPLPTLDTALTGTVLQVQSITGTILMFTIKGPRYVRGAITRISCAPEEQNNDTVKPPAYLVEAEVENQGEVHFACAGEIVILNREGRILARLPAQVGTGTILPNGQRLITARWTPRQTPPPGTYRASVRLTINGTRSLRYESDFSIP